MSGTGRERMLAMIRAGIARQGERRGDAPLPARPEPLVPARATAPGTDILALLRTQLAAAKATFDEVDGTGDVPAAIARYLAAGNHESRVRLAPDARITGLPWDNVKLLEVSAGRSHGDDATSVTPAVAAVAETGTLVLQSSAETPVTLHFLPDRHIVVIGRDQVVGTYEDALRRVRRDADGALPRTVNFVTGPSRSADIGKVLLMGAHGPKNLHVIIVAGGLGAAS